MVCEIIDKPNDISYDFLNDMIQEAHLENRRNGIKVNTTITDGNILKEKLGNAKTLVALYDGEIAGTLSYLMSREQRAWIGKYISLKLSFIAVLPEYSGKGIFTALIKKAQEFAECNGADALELTVVEKNPAKKIYEHFGFKPVDYLYRKASDQYSLRMIKWLRKDKSLPIMISCRYKLKKVIIKLRTQKRGK